MGEINVGHYVNVRDIALMAHIEQADKLKQPYFLHLRAVSEIIKTLPEYKQLNDMDRARAVEAAWLHDVLEDVEYTHMTAEKLEHLGVNPRTITAVIACSFRYFDYEETRDQFCVRILKDPIAIPVKIADILHNSDITRLMFLDDETIERLSTKGARALRILRRIDVVEPVPF